jgi:cell division protein FtsB
MSNINRDQQGKYAHARRVRRARKAKFFLFLLVVAAAVYGYYHIDLGNTQTFVNNTASSTAPIVDKHQSEIDKIKDRENFKKRVENQAKQVFLSEEIADRNAKIEALKAEIAGIEKELEQTRHEELSFQ